MRHDKHYETTISKKPITIFLALALLQTNQKPKTTDKKAMDHNQQTHHEPQTSKHILAKSKHESQKFHQQSLIIQKTPFYTNNGEIHTSIASRMMNRRKD